MGGLGFTADQIYQLAVRTAEHLNPDGAEPRYADLVEERGMVFSKMPVDTRTVCQRRVDLFSEIIRRPSGLPGMPMINGAAPTINLHATLADVISGRGIGWIDGIDEPLPNSVVQQLLCHSDVVTTLKDDHGQVLRHKKTRRFFSSAQNRALAARDGGCVWKGCDRPPSFCESYHVEEWRHDGYSPGRTNIENGASFQYGPLSVGGEVNDPVRQDLCVPVDRFSFCHGSLSERRGCKARMSSCNLLTRSMVK